MSNELHALPARLQARIRVEPDHIAFRGILPQTRKRLMTFTVLALVGSFFAGALQGGVDPALTTAGLACSVAVLAWLSDHFIGARHWTRLPKGTLDLRVVETESRGVRHLVHFRTLVAQLHGRDIPLMRARGTSEDYDLIPVVARSLETIAAR